MKTLRNVIGLNLILILLTSLVACKKDSDNNKTLKGSYTLGKRTINITKADYLLDKGAGASNDNFYIFIYGQDATDVIQLIFKDSAMPADGTYYYELEANGRLSFKGGSVTDANHLANSYINAGTVMIAKSGNDYTISFDVSAVAGEAKGAFTGSLENR